MANWSVARTGAVWTSILVMVAGCSYLQPPAQRRLLRHEGAPEPALSPATEERITALEAEHRRQVVRLEGIKREIAESQHRADQAKVTAEFQQCRASRAELQAEIAARHSQCVERVATFNHCKANKSQKTADGCLLGLLAMVATGGAAAWVVGGCAMGALDGEVSEGTCKIPACAANLEFVPQQVLLERGLDAMPLCGGYLGLQAQDLDAVALGGEKVLGVGPHTAAAEANLRTGDVVIAIDDVSLTSDGSLERALARRSDGDLMTISFVRNGRLWKAETHASHVDYHGKYNMSRLWLGITREWTSSVRYRDGIVISELDRGGPAARAGMSIGDGVLRIDGLAIQSVDDMRAALAEKTPGSAVVLTVLRRGQVVEHRIELDPRQGRAGL